MKQDAIKKGTYLQLTRTDSGAETALKNRRYVQVTRADSKVETDLETVLG